MTTETRSAVDHPAHYNAHPSGVECIELIRDLPFSIGSAIKYVYRRGSKGNHTQDLEMAAWYLHDWLYDDSGERRGPAPGSIAGAGHARLLQPAPNRNYWDAVIAAETDITAREFYLAAARGDVTGMGYAVRDLLKFAQTGQRPKPWWSK